MIVYNSNDGGGLSLVWQRQYLIGNVLLCKTNPWVCVGVDFKKNLKVYAHNVFISTLSSNM